MMKKSFSLFIKRPLSKRSFISGNFVKLKAIHFNPVVNSTQYFSPCRISFRYLSTSQINEVNEDITFNEKLVHKFFDGTRKNDEEFMSNKIINNSRYIDPPSESLLETTSKIEKSLSSNSYSYNIRLLKKTMASTKMDDYLFYLAISYCLRNKDLKNAQIFFNELINDTSIKLTYHSFASFLKYYAESEDFESCKYVWNIMEECNVRPGINCFIALIPLFITEKHPNISGISAILPYLDLYGMNDKKKFLKIAYDRYIKLNINLKPEQLLSDFSKYLSPKAALFDVMISVYYENKSIINIDKTLSLIDKIKSVPNPDLLEKVLIIYNSLGRHRQAFNIYHSWTINHNVRVNQTIVEELIKCCQAIGKFELSFYYYKKLTSRDHSPLQEDTILDLLKIIKRVKKYKKYLESILTDLEINEMKVTEKIIKQVAEICVQYRDHECLERLKKLAEKYSITISNDIFVKAKRNDNQLNDITSI